MTAAEGGRLPIAGDDDVVRVRQSVRAAAQRAKLSLVDQTKLVTATSELARNTLIYGGGGHAEVQIVEQDGRQGVRALFVDTGPGIPDIGLAMTDGWTSGNGLGLGLSGARRLVDEFDLDTGVGTGTTVTVVKWRRR
ncbi:ATP-binding protein [Actinokineospora guangxiensis]|uniref:ATP-binding protein n=1 Tax=Actinokineospora guangxiensis TaxID=1490288 RepID=A0ABW0EUY1_9PSEU